MLSHYSGDKEWPNELFEAVAFGFERAFQVWVPSQMVMNVMGTGPVPAFAPPYVPVGPVVGGTGTQTSGSLVSLKTPPPPGRRAAPDKCTGFRVTMERGS